MRLFFFMAIAMASVLFTVGCSSNNGASPGDSNVTFTVIVSGLYLDTGPLDGVEPGDNKRVDVFRDQASLDAVTTELNIDPGETVIDFTTSQVVLVTLGVQLSGGYSIAVTDAFDRGDIVKLLVSLESPGTGCIVTSALTHPYQLVEVQSLNTITIEERNVTLDC